MEINIFFVLHNHKIPTCFALMVNVSICRWKNFQNLHHAVIRHSVTANWSFDIFLPCEYLSFRFNSKIQVKFPLFAEPMRKSVKDRPFKWH